MHEQKHYTITSINLRDNRISDPGMVRISTYLRKDLSLSQFLRSLDLSGNVMRKKGAEALGKLVRSAPDLCHLSLEKLRLDDTVVRVLCRSIRHKGGALTSLNLSGNKIGDAGCVALAKLLSPPATTATGAQAQLGNSSTIASSSDGPAESDESEGIGPSSMLALKSLDLSWNGIQSQGAVALIDAIASNSSLQTLDLSWNAVGSKADMTSRPVAAALSDALTKNDTLLHLI